MTLLLATIGRDFAVLSQDTALAEGAEVRKAIQSAQLPPETAAELASFDGETVGKVMLAPERRLAFGSVGPFWGAVTVSHTILAAELELDHLTSALPQIWRALPAEVQAGPFTFMAVGYSKRAGGIIGIEASGPRKLRPRIVRARHVCTPQPAEDDPTAGEIASLWDRELSVAETLRLHTLVGQNCARANRAGRYGPNIALGGELQSAVVTADGAELIDGGPLEAHQAT